MMIRKFQGVESPSVPLVNGSNNYLHFLLWTWTLFLILVNLASTFSFWLILSLSLLVYRVTW